jgi:hypothetical protein
MKALAMFQSIGGEYERARARKSITAANPDEDANSSTCDSQEFPAVEWVIKRVREKDLAGSQTAASLASLFSKKRRIPMQHSNAKSEEKPVLRCRDMGFWFFELVDFEVVLLQ